MLVWTQTQKRQLLALSLVRNSLIYTGRNRNEQRNTQSSCQADKPSVCTNSHPSLQHAAIKSITPQEILQISKKTFGFQEAVTKLPTPSSQLMVFLPNPNSYLLAFYPPPSLVRNRSRYGPGHLQLVPLLILSLDNPHVSLHKLTS